MTKSDTNRLLLLAARVSFAAATAVATVLVWATFAWNESILSVDFLISSYSRVGPVPVSVVGFAVYGFLWVALSSSIFREGRMLELAEAVGCFLVLAFAETGSTEYVVDDRIGIIISYLVFRCSKTEQASA